MTEPKPSLAPDTLLGGRYRIVDVLGKGGMGCVYEAVHAEIGRQVAIKHLHEQFIEQPEVVERFHREARLAASIGHDNICEVIDVGRCDDGSPFLVMPRLRGVTFGDLLDQARENPPGLSPSRVADIVSQTLSALQAAHGARIVHRDLKPDNIFITKMGDRHDFVKLLDFGISKIMGSDSVSNLTRTGSAMGTPYYMSPEQAMGMKDVDQRTDIWAMGVILYEALAGRRPFDGDSFLSVLHQICAEPFPPPRKINRAVPVAFEEVILRAMSRDPDVRFQSAEEMRGALLAALKRSHGPDAVRISSATAYEKTVQSVAPPMRTDDTSSPDGTAPPTSWDSPTPSRV